MHVALLAVTALLLMSLVAFRPTDAHANGLSAETCATFRVEHAGRKRNETGNTVRLMLFDDNGVEQNCFQPKLNYWVKLNATTLIRGFLLQATDGARLPVSAGNGYQLPVDVTSGPCSNSVSHTQVRTSRSDNLYFPIAVKKSTRPMRFRYTVVFGPSSYLESQVAEFPCCQSMPVMPGSEPESDAPTTPTTPPSLGSGNQTNISQGIPVNTTCGRNITYTIKSINHTRNGIRYNCTIKKPLKGTTCVESCEDDNGEQLQCHILKHIPRRKGYTCVAYRDGDQADISYDVDSYTTTFNEVVTTGCKCYSVGGISSTSGSSES